MDATDGCACDCLDGFSGGSCSVCDDGFSGPECSVQQQLSLATAAVVSVGLIGLVCCCFMAARRELVLKVCGAQYLKNARTTLRASKRAVAVAGYIVDELAESGGIGQEAAIDLEMSATSDVVSAQGSIAHSHLSKGSVAISQQSQVSCVPSNSSLSQSILHRVLQSPDENCCQLRDHLCRDEATSFRGGTSGGDCPQCFLASSTIPIGHGLHKEIQDLRQDDFVLDSAGNSLQVLKVQFGTSTKVYRLRTPSTTMHVTACHRMIARARDDATRTEPIISAELKAHQHSEGQDPEGDHLIVSRDPHGRGVSEEPLIEKVHVQGTYDIVNLKFAKDVDVDVAHPFVLRSRGQGHSRFCKKRRNDPRKQPTPSGSPRAIGRCMAASQGTDA
jgi:hypothetical protein